MKNELWAFVIPVAMAIPSFSQPGPGTQPSPPGAVIPVPPPGSGTLQAPIFYADPAMQAQFATVWSYMRLPSPLKFGDQYLSMLGDRAGFFIFAIMADRARTIQNPAVTLSAGEMLTALDIVHKSFAMPKFIENRGDLKPNSSLALLKLFQGAAVGQAVKDRIVVETNFLNSVPQVIIPDPLAPLGPPPPPGTTPFR